MDFSRFVSRKSLAALAAFLAVLAGGGTLVLTADPDDEGVAPATITVPVDGPDADRKPDDKIVAGGQAPAVLADAKATPEQFDLSGDLRGDDPGPANVIEGPLATPNWPGCSTRFLPVNFSSRRGQKITGFGLHYTAGPNIAGLADMNGLTAFASRASAGVSWHFLIDAEGHCYYSVPVSMKAWTIGNLNGQTINVEMIGRGNEPTYGGTAGMRKLGEVVRRAARIYGFPVRLGAVDGNCRITRPGIITHWMGGSCAGGHVDIKPYDIAAVVRDIASGGVTATDRVTCRKLNAWRNAGRPHGGEWERNSVRRKAALTRRGVTCTAKGPVRS
jgi:hypothetical protein